MNRPSMRITTLLLGFAAKSKPLLVKILPISILRRTKKALIENEMKKNANNVMLPFSRNRYADGVNLIGYIRADLGLGQSCRLVAKALDLSDVSFSIFNYEQISAIQYGDHSWDSKISNELPYNMNIIHIQPYELPLARISLGSDLFDYRYNIAFWLWELEEFPAEWNNAFNLIDEIWTPSEHAANSIRKATNKPVCVIPYPIVDVPTDDSYNRTYFGLPQDKCLFLCMYDCNSTIDRKNPISVIRAFVEAFPASEDNDAWLVIKVNNPQREDLRIIEEELGSRSNYTIIAKTVTKIEVNSLIKICDVYVSLHRAEGFGLVPAEAMFLGTTLICTNWSSTTEFMDSNTACLVDYKLIPIAKDTGAYKVGQRWADPDVHQTAKYMRTMCLDGERRRQLAERAKEYIRKQLSAERVSRLIQKRISDIYNEDSK